MSFQERTNKAFVLFFPRSLKQDHRQTQNEALLWRTITWPFRWNPCMKNL
jgi:hypothetical protein